MSGRFTFPVLLVFVSLFGRYANSQPSSAPALHSYTGFIEKKINHNSVKSVEQLFSLLPKEFFSNYTLVHSSGSLQASSWKNPRAVLFHPSGSFIMTFNGDPKLKGFHTLDIFEFNPKTRVYEAREILFDPNAQNVAKVDWEPGDRCVGCHASTPGIHPSHESYSGGFYPKTYGSFGARISSLEAVHVKEYIENQSQHPRYRFLPPLKLNETNGTLNRNQTPELGRGLHDRLNEALGFALYKSQFKPFRYALLGALQCSATENDPAPMSEYPVDLFLPDELVKQFKIKYQDIESETKRYTSGESALKNFEKNFGQPLPQRERQYLNAREWQVPSRIGYLMKNLAQVTTTVPKSFDWLFWSLTIHNQTGYGGTTFATEQFNEYLLDPIFDHQLYLIHKKIQRRKKHPYAPYAITRAEKLKICPILVRKSK